MKAISSRVWGESKTKFGARFSSQAFLICLLWFRWPKRSQPQAKSGMPLQRTQPYRVESASRTSKAGPSRRRTTPSARSSMSGSPDVDHLELVDVDESL